MRLGIRAVVSSFLFFIAFPGGAFSQVEFIGESPGDRGILGWVIDARLGFPVINADISILDTLGELIGATFANEAGHFRLTAPDPGPYLLRVERLGYSIIESTVRYPGGVAQVLRISLSAQPIEVPGVEARAHPGALHAEMTMDGFEARAARKAAGFFFKRKD